MNNDRGKAYEQRVVACETELHACLLALNQRHSTLAISAALARSLGDLLNVLQERGEITRDIARRTLQAADRAAWAVPGHRRAADVLRFNRK